MSFTSLLIPEYTQTVGDIFNRDLYDEDRMALVGFHDMPRFSVPSLWHDPSSTRKVNSDNPEADTLYATNQSVLSTIPQKRRAEDSAAPPSVKRHATEALLHSTRNERLIRLERTPSLINYSPSPSSARSPKRLTSRAHVYCSTHASPHPIHVGHESLERIATPRCLKAKLQQVVERLVQVSGDALVSQSSVLTKHPIGRRYEVACKRPKLDISQPPPLLSESSDVPGPSTGRRTQEPQLPDNNVPPPQSYCHPQQMPPGIPMIPVKTRLGVHSSDLWPLLHETLSISKNQLHHDATSFAEELKAADLKKSVKQISAVIKLEVSNAREELASHITHEASLLRLELHFSHHKFLTQLHEDIMHLERSVLQPSNQSPSANGSHSKEQSHPPPDSNMATSSSNHIDNSEVGGLGIWQKLQHWI
ncbi:hypothetical protein JAAARDRAFT_195736 [Jaapia argillacea MUCL 33604]|uniref:Uncharacterized protein n=1 Tax=Jaapia argillacea MUCL 33604 TaxID=933084 RepID=A0A067PVN0_9AGAM|nr:hypothetical protein JAAARDRAFT_195736 [Jaapia argillacea MUCL 33604]